MARGEFTVKARIEAEDRASAQLSRIGAGFRNFGSFLSRSFVITLGDVSRAIRGTFAALSSFVDAASESEDAVSKLNSAFSVYGSVAADASKAALAQAAAIQKTTKFTDEAVISAQALLSTYNVSAQQIPKATQAVVDLAAALGVSLDAAATQLGGTLSGVVGRGLARLVPALRDLDEASLRSGAAIDLLADKLEGRAAAAGATFSGVMARLSNSIGEFRERIGESITGNEELRKSFEELNTALQKTPALVELIADSSGLLAHVFARTLINTNAEVEAIKSFGDHLTDLKNLLIGAITLEDDYAEKIAKTSQAHVEAVAAVDERAVSEERLATILEAEAKTFNALAASAESLGVTLESKLNAQLEKNADLLIDAERAARQGVITWRDFEAIQRAVADANQEVTKELTGVTQAAAKTSQAYTALTANGKGVVVSLQQQAAQALITARTFDLLAQSTGRAAAVEAAVASGGTLIQGGTRIRFGSSSSQSGSRLVAAPGFMGSAGPTYRGGFGWAVGIGYGGYGASVGMNAPVYGYR